MEIKIVGSIPDETSLDEIQNIAKVFVYEQRMKNFNYPIKDNISKTKKPLQLFKKIDSHQKNSPNYLSHVMVKGLV